MAADNQDSESGEAEMIDTANYQEHADKGLAQTERCDRCGAHAHIHVMLNSGNVLLFCSHHGASMMDALKALPNVLIDDYRPYLTAQEALLKHDSLKS